MLLELREIHWQNSSQKLKVYTDTNKHNCTGHSPLPPWRLKWWWTESCILPLRAYTYPTSTYAILNVVGYKTGKLTYIRFFVADTKNKVTSQAASVLIGYLEFYVITEQPSVGI